MFPLFTKHTLSSKGTLHIFTHKSVGLLSGKILPRLKHFWRGLLNFDAFSCFLTKNHVRGHPDLPCKERWYSAPVPGERTLLGGKEKRGLGRTQTDAPKAGGNCQSACQSPHEIITEREQSWVFSLRKIIGVFLELAFHLNFLSISKFEIWDS